MKKLMNWHKRLLEDIQKRFGISDYAMLWFIGLAYFVIISSFAGGVIVGIIIGFLIV